MRNVMSQEMLMYRDVSEVPLPKGLYLGFLKIQVSVESVRILVPLKTPNCLPYAKIRDCPNVSRWVISNPFCSAVETGDSIV